jgi:hypothetical protein
LLTAADIAAVAALHPPMLQLSPLQQQGFVVLDMLAVMFATPQQQQQQQDQEQQQEQQEHMGG